MAALLCAALSASAFIGSGPGRPLPTPSTSVRVAHSPVAILALNEVSSLPSPRGEPLDRMRRIVQLRQLRSRRQDRQQLSSEADAEAKLLERILPVLLILLLSIGNGQQIYHVLQQLQFVDETQQLFGSQLDFDLVTDVLIAGEVNDGLSNVVGQAVAEGLGGPVLQAVAEVLLNAAAAKAFGRRLIPLLIVGEAAIDALCELAGQSVGDVLGEGLRPLGEALLGMVAELQGLPLVEVLQGLSTT